MPSDTIPRRVVLRSLAGLGVGSLAFQRALAVDVADQGVIHAEMIRQAEWIAGLELSDEDREATAGAVQRAVQGFRAVRDVDLEYDVPPAVRFDAQPQATPSAGPIHVTAAFQESAAPARPASDEALAFLPVRELAALIRTRKVTSEELTQLYLERLRKYDPSLRCVVTRTDELALKQARRADAEIASGHYRGPLHGVPWGAKDLIAYPGYKTTWGAAPFEEQVLTGKATVAQRLDDAGAVLVAKLSLGALAWGDQWFGGKTRNPWNPQQGSSGSSAGSASATAAGLVGFSLGSETLGSIVSPCRRCGCSGLRPTFGRVSRFGCMPLAWSMDKIGPICRSVEDCAVVLAAICGSDGQDPTVVDRPFAWPRGRSLRDLRVGYFEHDRDPAERHELVTLRELGVSLVPIQLPTTYPINALTIILNTEAASVFDQLTRDNISAGLNRWPNAWRQGQFVPAVEYLRANRVRTLVMREMQELMERVDLYVGGDDLALTNLTGHPTVVLPDGFVERNEHRVPRSITFTGRLFGETELLAVAHAYQQVRGFHLEHPRLEMAGKVGGEGDEGKE